MRTNGIIKFSLIMFLAIILCIVGYMTLPAQAAGDGGVDVIVYGPYTNFYYRVVRPSDKKIFTTSGLSTTPTWNATSCISVTYDVNTGGFPVDFDTTLPAGEYDFLVYDAAVPANTDVPVLGKRMGWNGTTLMFFKDM